MKQFIFLSIVLSTCFVLSHPSFIEVSQAPQIEIINQTQHTCQIHHDAYVHSTKNIGLVALLTSMFIGGCRVGLESIVQPFMALAGWGYWSWNLEDCDIGQSIRAHQTVKYHYSRCRDRMQFHCDDDSESLSFEFLPDGRWTEIVGLHLKQNPKSEVTIVLQDNNHAVIQKK